MTITVKILKVIIARNMNIINSKDLQRIFYKIKSELMSFNILIKLGVLN